VAGIGLFIGLCGSIALEKLLRFSVFATAKFDGVSLLAIILALSAVAWLAAWLPARRAAKLDPVIALRQDV
jgi:ABC-type antimicrobial peptide transport system permease subunit